MQKVLNELLGKYNNEVLPPLSTVEVDDFEKSNNVILPTDFREILLNFDGGEILIPGPMIFGLKINPLRKTIKEINSKNIRQNFSIPTDYLIVAKLNYGDFICINLNSPYEVIQWDHENDEEFCKWNSLTDWLDDSISAFNEFEVLNNEN